LKQILWFITSLLIVTLFLFLVREPILEAMGSFLVVQDELKKADVIIVLGGGGNKRVEEAARLYKKGYSKYMIMTGGLNIVQTNEAKRMRHHATHLDIPDENIILEPKAQHTYEHPIFVKPIIQARGFRSAIVVSSPFHMRRTAMLFDRAFKNSGIKFIYYPVQDSWFKIDEWWKNDTFRRIVSNEYKKLIVNAFGIRVSKFAVKLVGRKNSGTEVEDFN